MRSSLVFPACTLAELRQNLLSVSPNEAASVLLAGRAIRGWQTRLLIREVVRVPPRAYGVQEPMRLTIKPEFLAPLLKRARNEGWSLIFTHTHPFDQIPRFSFTDDEGERVLMPSVFGRAADRPHGALVLGTAGFDARLWRGDSTEPEAIDTIIESGKDIRIHRKNEQQGSEILPESDRSVRAFGTLGQKILSKLSVGIVGLGGTGSIVAEQLAHLRIGHMIFLDSDKIERTNLNRVVGANKRSIGKAKVQVAAENVRRVEPNIRVTPVEGNVLIAKDAAKLLDADFLFCCTDSHGSRAVLNQLAYQYMIPSVDMGVRIQVTKGKVQSISGRVQMLAPGLPCLVCHSLLDPEEVRRDLLSDEERARDPYIVGAHEPQPAVISLNGTVASMGVTMMLAAVTGLPSGARHEILLAERGIVRTVESKADQNCVVCSLRGALGRGDRWRMPWRIL